MNSTYQLITRGMPWYDAQAYCHAIGGHLAAFETEEEFSSVSSYIPPGDAHHFGLNDLKEESKYVWEHNGQEVGPYTSWADGEPHDRWYEDCGALYNGKWYDNTCKEWRTYAFICEFAKP